jgi:hypothetical protein
VKVEGAHRDVVEKLNAALVNAVEEDGIAEIGAHLVQNAAAQRLLDVRRLGAVMTGHVTRDGLENVIVKINLDVSRVGVYIGKGNAIQSW